MHTTDVPLAPEERLREVAAILAAGLLRLRTRPQLAGPADMSGKPAAPRKRAESSQKALGLSAPPRPDPPTG